MLVQLPPPATTGGPLEQVESAFGTLRTGHVYHFRYQGTTGQAVGLRAALFAIYRSGRGDVMLTVPAQTYGRPTQRSFLLSSLTSAVEEEDEPAPEPVDPLAARRDAVAAFSRDVERLAATGDGWRARGWHSDTADRFARQLLNVCSLARDDGDASDDEVSLLASTILHHLSRKGTVQRPGEVDALARDLRTPGQRQLADLVEGVRKRAPKESGARLVFANLAAAIVLQDVLDQDTTAWANGLWDFIYRGDTPLIP